MLLVNVDDMLNLTNSSIRTKTSKIGIEKDQTFTFFDTDKFLGNLDMMPEGRPLTPQQLAEVFRCSFTEGHIDWTKD